MGPCSSCGSFWRPPMRTIRAAVAILIFALASGLCPAQTQAKPEPKTAAAKEGKSLLRKDLLQFRKQTAAPPMRNIFAPRAGFSRPGEAGHPGAPLPAADSQAADESGATDGHAGDAPDRS